jgi:hypothetical protein
MHSTPFPATLTVIRKEFSQLYPYLKSIFGTPTPISLSVEGQPKQVLSQQGARQGEPLSSFFFGICFQQAIRPHHPDIKQQDIELLGTPIVVFQSKLPIS